MTSGPRSSSPLARRRRRTTASIRAMTSSGWQGFAIQSSAPSRRPRTRWATVESLRADDHAEPGHHPRDPLEERPRVVGGEHGEVDEQRVDLHRHELVGRDGTAEDAVLPAGGVEPLAEHLEKGAVAIDDRDSECSVRSAHEVGPRRNRVRPDLDRSGAGRPKRGNPRPVTGFSQAVAGMFTAGDGLVPRLSTHRGILLSCRARPSSCPRPRAVFLQQRRPVKSER